MKRLTALRETAGLSRWDLAKLANIYPNRLGAIENGRIVPGPDSVELKRLAAALGWLGAPGDLLAEADDAARG